MAAGQAELPVLLHVFQDQKEHIIPWFGLQKLADLCLMPHRNGHHREMVQPPVLPFQQKAQGVGPGRGHLEQLRRGQSQ